MKYDPQSIEPKWQEVWRSEKVYQAKNGGDKPKFYALDMFPYPSGAGLHVGHPLGYIASDIFARYRKLQGYNVLHPMGFDSFGLPAEQYAIQTGEHPAITTETNINRYKNQLNKIGFAYDWEREVRTSDPSYYRWTQWIFKQLFNSWFNKDADKAEDIRSLISKFESSGSAHVHAVNEAHDPFSAEDWNAFDNKQKSDILLRYRLAYQADSWVNWCPALGTVLANDEVKDGFSERGGHPVEQKRMKQWSMRITAYAERLLEGLERIDWSDSLKEQQRNWIGKSKGAVVRFRIHGNEGEIEVFTTRPDTIFGVSFITLAPEHPLVNEITTDEQREVVQAYAEKAGRKTERERQANVKDISGCFTGSYAEHPFTGKRIPIWIGEYVLASYGTGAVMAVPAGDQRDWDFARHFQIDIPHIFDGADISKAAYTEKEIPLKDSDFLNGMKGQEAIEKAIGAIEAEGIGRGKVNYRLRDAVFGRQRYWGEPIPVYYKEDVPHVLEDSELPLELPDVDKYLPTEDGEPPLARAKNWKYQGKYEYEHSTMPGWAGSSWYFLRYMDPHNNEVFADPETMQYWNQVDLYIGGSEHATGHLLYSRFWAKFLHDIGYITFDEPFKKLINQGMILGRSSFIYRVKGEDKLVSYGLRKEFLTSRLHIDISLVGTNDELNIEKFKLSGEEFQNAELLLEDGKYICGSEVEKMSKSKFNVVTPDDLVEEYGADTLRCYEMFLGPLEQSKPWDTQGITGVSGFLKKLWRLFYDNNGLILTDEEPNKKELKVLHTCIKRVHEDLERYSFNTVVSQFMITVNELTELNCHKKAILDPLLVLVSPFAPHIAEELWQASGNQGLVVSASFPELNPAFLVEDEVIYPIQFNGKKRFDLAVPNGLSKEEIEKLVLRAEESARYLEGKPPKKVIVVPGRIVNIVI